MQNAMQQRGNNPRQPRA
jgi:hypothetical protein